MTQTAEEIVNESTTDPECRYSTRANTKMLCIYSTDRLRQEGYILDVTVNPRVHDSVAFGGLYELTEHYPEIQNVVADAGYKTPWFKSSDDEEYRYYHTQDLQV
ncbi:MAG: hypothetical protein ACLS48_11500 [[Eubacterium] siraeum]